MQRAAQVQHRRTCIQRVAQRINRALIFHAKAKLSELVGMPLESEQGVLMTSIIAAAIVGAIAGGIAAGIVALLFSVKGKQVGNSKSKQIATGLAFAIFFAGLNASGLKSFIQTRLENKSRVEKIIGSKVNVVVNHPKWISAIKSLTDQGHNAQTAGALINVYGIERLDPKLIIERYQLADTLITRSNDAKFCSSFLLAEPYYQANLQKNLDLLSDEELNRWAEINVAAMLAYLDNAPRPILDEADVEKLFLEISQRMPDEAFANFTSVLENPATASDEEKCQTSKLIAALLRELEPPLNHQFAISLVKQAN